MYVLRKQLNMLTAVLSSVTNGRIPSSNSRFITGISIQIGKLAIKHLPGSSKKL